MMVYCVFIVVLVGRNGLLCSTSKRLKVVRLSPVDRVRSIISRLLVNEEIWVHPSPNSTCINVISLFSSAGCRIHSAANHPQSHWHRLSLLRTGGGISQHSERPRNPRLAVDIQQDCVHGTHHLPQPAGLSALHQQTVGLLLPAGYFTRHDTAGVLWGNNVTLVLVWT